MKALLQATVTVLLFVSLSAAQNTTAPAEIQNLNVVRDGAQLNVDITVTSPVTPTVTVATGPDRLVVELPNTSASARQRLVPVNQDGVRDLRIGLHSASPPVTRVVIDLAQARPYRVSTNGNVITLAILPAENAARERRGSPVPAASAPIWGRLKPHRQEPVPTAANAADSEAETIVPPKPFPPIQLPDGTTVPSKTSAAASASKPNAAHPSYGSLQQGTVFPNAGAPGTGYVPPVSGATANQPGTATAAAKTPSGAGAAGSSTPAPASTLTTVTTAVVARMGSVGSPSTNAAANALPIAPPAPVIEARISVRPYPGIVSPAAPQPAVAAPVTAAPAANVIAATPAVSETSHSSAAEAAARQLPPGLQIQAVPPAATHAGSEVVAPASTPSNPSAPAALPTVPTTAPSPATPMPSAPASSVTTVAAAQPTANPSSVATATSAQPDEPLPTLATRQPNSEIRMGFKVKYVAAGAAYLEGGKEAGLSEGMKLEVRDNVSRAPAGSNDVYGPTVAELAVLSVADTSTVAEIHDGAKRDVKPGDWAYLSSEDTQALVAQRSLSPTRKYPVVISFTEGSDPLAEEAHAEVPRPAMPDINRARGRFGFDYSSIMSQGMTSSSLGMSVMTDITRIGGTYWNMSGYWRGRLTSTSATQQQTLQDLINRTYHLAMTYDNPDSHFVAGFGRLYLPYATSLETIDGGYVGLRVSKVATLGLFAGSTPDPTSWSYNPQQQIGGTFVNFRGGSFDDFRYSDTFGMGVEMLKWKINRPFVFGENTLSYKRLFALYSAVQADSPAGNQAVAAPGAGLSRSFTTFRVQPHRRIEFDVNHTYFRDIPTYDPSLISTGLLDKYLFQGFSAGTRVEVLKSVWLYTTLGRSSRSGDKNASLNQLYGLTFDHLPGTRIRADLHYSKFSSAFGSGSYEAASVSRSFHDFFRWEILAGRQAYVSSLATNNSSKFVTGNLDLPLGSHYYLQGGFTANRGGTQNYNQALFSFGYRFDTRPAGSSK